MAPPNPKFPYQSVAHVDYGWHERGGYFAYIFGILPSPESRSGVFHVMEERWVGSEALARKAADEFRRSFARRYRPVASDQWSHLRKE